MKLSVVYIVYNEEHIIKKSLESVQSIADEIIIVDSYSTDNTLKICKEFPNIKIFQHSFHGYGQQKNIAINYAQNEWILSLDADEILNKTLQEDIIRNIKTTTYTAYYLRRKHVFLGKKFNYGRECNYPILRLFQKGKGSFTNNTIHETLKTSGKLGVLKGFLEHYTTKDLTDFLQKMIKYSQMSAESYYKNGKKANWIKIIFHFPFIFLKEYFFYRNFMNGYQGFVWSLISAMSATIKYFYLKEYIDNHSKNIEII